MFNARTNRIECPTCRVPMRPFGGRLTAGFEDLPEVFLCVGCGYNVDLAWAVGVALNERAALKRRALAAQRLVENLYGVPHENGNGKPSLKKRVVKTLIRALEKTVE